MVTCFYCGSNVGIVEYRYEGIGRDVGRVVWLCKALGLCKRRFAQQVLNREYL